MLLLSLRSCPSEKPLPDLIYFRLNADVATLDPAFITDVNNASIAAKIYQGLVKLDDSLQIVPDIAERWEILDKGRLYRFYLREDQYFCNQRAVTAYDFKYSYDRILDKQAISPNRWVFERVLSFNAQSSKVFEIRLKESFPPFLSMLTMPAAYVVPKEEVERLGREFSFKPCGSGAYYLQKRIPGREIHLLADQNKLPLSKGFRGLVYRIIPEDITAITEFEIGNLDVIGIPASAYSRFIKNPKWKGLMSGSQGLNTYYLGMNCEKPPFKDRRIRQSVAHALDREKILNTFMEKRGRLAKGIVPDLLRNWVVDNAFEYNPTKSREILAEIGSKEVKALMLITAEQDVIDLAEIIQHYLKEVGIKIEIRQIEWSAFKEAVNKGHADMFWLSWWADYPEPENFLYPLFHSSNKGYGGNRTRYDNKRVDALLDQARRDPDKDRSLSLYRETEKIILSDMPLIPFWHRTDYVARQQWIEEFDTYPIYTMDKGLSISKRRQDLGKQ